MMMMMIMIMMIIIIIINSMVVVIIIRLQIRLLQKKCKWERFLSRDYNRVVGSNLTAGFLCFLVLNFIGSNSNAAVPQAKNTALWLKLKAPRFTINSETEKIIGERRMKFLNSCDIWGSHGGFGSVKSSGMLRFAVVLVSSPGESRKCVYVCVCVWGGGRGA